MYLFSKIRLNTVVVPALALLIINMLLASCTSTVKMVTDERLLKEPLTVNGTNGNMIRQKIDFGSYRTIKVRRSAWKTNSSYSGIPEIFTVAFERSKQTIQFDMEDADRRTSQVDCLDMTNTKDFVLGSNPNSLINIIGDVAGVGGKNIEVYRAIIKVDNEYPWFLELDHVRFNTYKTRYVATLKQGDKTYKLIPIQQIQGKKGPVTVGTVGVEIRNDNDEPVAALSFIGKPQVSFNTQDPAERFLLANACTALLVHNPR